MFDFLPTLILLQIGEGADSSGCYQRLLNERPLWILVQPAKWVLTSRASRARLARARIVSLWGEGVLGHNRNVCSIWQAPPGTFVPFFGLSLLRNYSALTHAGLSSCFKSSRTSQPLNVGYGDFVANSHCCISYHSFQRLKTCLDHLTSCRTSRRDSLATRHGSSSN